ncbi:MAG TPA: polysaccharide biosynthesis/export family protein [Rhizomicrobium sp.]|jgi:polysaccharide export outer membrane protein|nr:polysaccharide biosynthesis/export family protein [Rhizomicrobium sp.]
MGKESQEKSVVAACCVRAMSFLAVGVIAAGCSGAMTGSPAALAQADAAARNYRLAPGDKVHVAVFNEANLSGDYVIEPDGHITLPLAGSVTAAGLTVPQLQLAVVKTLGNGFVQDPSVTVTAIDLRPYYILGEVNKPGRYSYSPDLTVMQAVATAEGFTYRADNTAVYIRHKSDPSESEVSLTATTAVLPGDTIRVAQRYF